MITRRDMLAAAGAASCLGLTRAGRAAASETVPASTWSAGLGARMRLVRGTPLGTDKGWQAAVQIRLDPGYTTYWRMPGEAGIPPSFDWARSTNLASVSAAWPVPRRFDEAGASVIGYAGDGVVLPLRVRAENEDEPVDLKLTLTYAACKNICVPEKGEAALTLRRDLPEGVFDALIATAARDVPTRADAASLGLDRPGAVALGLAGGHRGLSLRPRLEEGEHLMDVFVEGADNWLFGAPRISGAGTVSEATLPLVDHPKGIDLSTRIPFTLTLLTDMRAIETAVASTPMP